MPSSNADIIRKLNEEYEDSLFRLLMDDVAKKEGKLLYEENEQLKNDLENLPSQKDVNRFIKLLDAHLKKSKINTKNRLASKIFTRKTAVVFALLISFSTMILTVRAFRIQVLNFLISIEPNYTAFQLIDDNEELNNEKLILNWTNSYFPTYIPEGYNISNISYSDSIK